jgi:peptidoglycan glycosyltransferase
VKQARDRKKPAADKAARSRRWKIFRRTCYVLVLLGVATPILGFMAAYIVQDVPRPSDLTNDQVAHIYANDGETVLSQVVPSSGNRTEVTIDEVPKHVIDSVLAAEDREFYTNPGFSITGFARAALGQLTGNEGAGGGSTITQQYVKNAIVGDDYSVTRKLKELVISAKMTRQWDKNEILAAYLNTIYFGRGAYGIDAAARAYFDKPLSELTVAEGAALAACIQLPSMDPENNPQHAQDRFNYVLDGMVAGGTLSAGERASTVYPALLPLSDSGGDEADDSGPGGLIRTQVLNELAANNISDSLLASEGLQITTTIDPSAQEAAVSAARSNLEGEPENLRTAVVSVDPRTGEVKAYYGGELGTGFDFANAGLQSGSSFKVFSLAAALDQGIPLSKMYDSKPLELNGVTINNSEGSSCGTCTIAEAFKRSLNTPMYRQMLELDNGPFDVAAMAHAAGIPEEIPGVGPSLTEPDGSGPNNGIVLGQYQVRVIDMASAYATMAAEGVYRAPHFISKVVTANGVVLLDREEDYGEQRVDEVVANNVTAAMEPIAASSRNHQLDGGRASAAKTGTAQLGDTGNNKDAWMVGYTPSLSTAVWVGTPDGDALLDYNGAAIYGSGLPSDIWKDTMDTALAGTDYETFPKPGKIGGQAGIPTFTGPPTTTTRPPKPTVPAMPGVPPDVNNFLNQLLGGDEQPAGALPTSEIVPPTLGRPPADDEDDPGSSSYGSPSNEPSSDYPTSDYPSPDSPSLGAP